MARITVCHHEASVIEMYRFGGDGNPFLVLPEMKLSGALSNRSFFPYQHADQISAPWPQPAEFLTSGLNFPGVVFVVTLNASILETSPSLGLGLSDSGIEADIACPTIGTTEANSPRDDRDYKNLTLSLCHFA